MKFRKVIKEELRKDGGDSRIAGALHAVVDVNVGERGEKHGQVSSHQRIVQTSKVSATDKSPPRNDKQDTGDEPGKETG